MDDGEIAVLTADTVDGFDDELVPVEKKHSRWMGRVRRREAAIPPSCSEIKEQPRPCRRPSLPVSGTAG